MSMVIEVHLKGPIATGVAEPAVKRFIRNAVEAIVQAGEQRLDERLRPRPAGVFQSESYAAAHGYRHAGGAGYAGSIQGEVQMDRGKITDQGLFVYGPWLEGVSTRNQTTRFKGYASFRKVRDEIDKDKVSIVRPAIGILLKELQS